MMLFCMADRS